MTPGKFNNPDHILSMLEEIFSAINLVSDAPKLFQQVLDFCIRFTGATTGSLIVVNPETEILEIKVARGLGANIEEKVKLTVGEGLTGWVAQHKKPLMCNNVKQDKRYVPIKEYIQSELVIPLLFEEKVIGIISVDSSKLNAFAESDLNFLTLIAPLLTQIVRNIELFDSLRKQYERDEILLEVNQAVIEAPTLKNALHKVLQILADALGFIRGSIVLKHPNKELMNIIVGYGLSIEEQKRGSYKLGEGIVGKIFETGEPVIIRDLQKEKKFLDKTKSRPGFENISFIAYPVRFKHEVLGVIWFDKNYELSSSSISNDLHLLEFVTSFLTQLLKHFAYNQEERQSAGPSFFGDIFSFQIVTESSPVLQILASLRQMSSEAIQVLICHSSCYERRALASYTYLHKAHPHHPFLYIDAGEPSENREDLFASYDQLAKIVNNNFLFIDNFHLLLPEYQELIASAKTNKRQFVAATPLTPSALQQTKYIIPEMWDTFRAVLSFPSFHERVSDLRQYLQKFIVQINQAWKTQINGIQPEAEEIILQKILGNNDPVTALFFQTMNIALITREGTISPDDIHFALNEISSEKYRIPDNARQALSEYITSTISSSQGELYDKGLEFYETMLLNTVYQQTGGNKKKIAQILGLNRTTVYKKLRKYGFFKG